MRFANKTSAGFAHVRALVHSADDSISRRPHTAARFRQKSAFHSRTAPPCTQIIARGARAKNRRSSRFSYTAPCKRMPAQQLYVCSNAVRFTTVVVAVPLNHEYRPTHLVGMRGERCMRKTHDADECRRVAANTCCHLT